MLLPAVSPVVSHNSQKPLGSWGLPLVCSGGPWLTGDQGRHRKGTLTLAASLDLGMNACPKKPVALSLHVHFVGVLGSLVASVAVFTLYNQVSSSACNREPRSD